MLHTAKAAPLSLTGWNVHKDDECDYLHFLEKTFIQCTIKLQLLTHFDPIITCYHLNVSDRGQISE